MFLFPSHVHYFTHKMLTNITPIHYMPIIKFNGAFYPRLLSLLCTYSFVSLSLDYRWTTVNRLLWADEG